VKNADVGQLSRKKTQGAVEVKAEVKRELVGPLEVVGVVDSGHGAVVHLRRMQFRRTQLRRGHLRITQLWDSRAERRYAGSCGQT